MSLALLVGAQLWAVTLLAPLDERLGARDAILPFRTWSLAMKHATRTRWPLIIGASCITLLACAS